MLCFEICSHFYSTFFRLTFLPTLSGSNFFKSFFQLFCLPLLFPLFKGLFRSRSFFAVFFTGMFNLVADAFCLYSGIINRAVIVVVAIMILVSVGVVVAIVLGVKNAKNVKNANETCVQCCVTNRFFQFSSFI